MLQAVKWTYGATQAALSFAQTRSPEHRQLILRIQRVVMILDVAFLISDYDDFFSALNKDKVQDVKWYQNPTVLMGAQALISAVSFVYLNRKVPIDLNGTLYWAAPVTQRITEWLIFQRSFVNLALTCITEDVGRIGLALLQTFTFYQYSKLIWIQAEAPFSLTFEPSPGFPDPATYSGKALFHFLVPCNGSISSICQEIQDYAKNVFQNIISRSRSHFYVIDPPRTIHGHSFLGIDRTIYYLSRLPEKWTKIDVTLSAPSARILDSVSGYLMNAAQTKLNLKVV
jgi:hypothetical protein